MTRRLGPFVLERTVGKGGMGRVYRAIHEAQQVPVALKVDLHPPAATSTMAFLHEVQIVAALDHPNVVMVLDHGVVGDGVVGPDGETLRPGARWLAMELAGGGTVAERLPQNWAEVRHVVCGLLDALAHAHARDVVHLDIKPANLLLAGGSIAAAPQGLLDARIVLSDFGISRRRTAASVDGESVGTPTYMAPEQIEGRWRDQGPWTDLYAVGVLLWQLVCGRAPYDGRTLDILRKHLYEEPGAFEPTMRVPRGLEAFCRTLLVKPHDERVSFASTARAELDALTRGRRRSPTEGRGRSFSPLHGAGIALFGMREPVLVGRDAEREVLWQTLSAVRDHGQARCVFVSGPSGVGKTRVARSLCERAHESGLAATLRATHAADGRPGGGLVALLHHDLGTHGLRGLALQERLEACLPTGVVDRRRLAAVLSPDDAARSPVAPAELRQLTIGVLSARAAQGPLIVLLDDIHRDVSTLQMVDSLLSLQELQPRPILVVATWSDPELAESPEAADLVAEMRDDPSVHVVPLAPLDREGSRRLVRDLLGLEGALAERVERRTAGNPQFARELIGAWVEQGVLTPSSRGFRLADGAAGRVPPSVASVWESRLTDALSGHRAGSVEALYVAAALGDVVSNVEWLGACDVLELSPDPGLFAALRKRHLIHLDDGDGERWRFVHGALREQLVAASRDAGHWTHHNLGIAIYMREAGTSIPAERRARHFLEAEVYDEAVDPLIEAINDRIDVGDLRSPELVDALRAALERLGLLGKSPAWAEMQTLDALRARAIGELDTAERLALEVVRVATDRHWGAVSGKALREVARVMWAQGRHDDAIQYARRAKAVFQARKDVVRAADCHLVEANVLMGMGRFDASQIALAEIIEALEDLAPERVVSAMLSMMRVANLRGDVAATRTWLTMTRARAAPLGLQLALAICANVEGELERAAGDADRAAEFYLEAVDRYRRLESADFVIPLLNLGILDVLAGRDASAIQRMRSLLAHLRRHRNDLHDTYTHMVLMAAFTSEAAHSDAVGSLDIVRAYVTSSGLVDPDLAEMAELTGERMQSHGWAEASAAFALAAQQFHDSGRMDDADRVRARLGDP